MATDINRTTSIALPGEVSSEILQKTQESSAALPPGGIFIVAPMPSFIIQERDFCIEILFGRIEIFIFQIIQKTCPSDIRIIEREIGISQEKSRPGHPLEKQR